LNTDLENFKAMLDRAGYQFLEDTDLEPQDLGHFEYIQVTTTSFIIVAFGPGRVGDADTYMNMKFKHDGTFAEHNCGHEEE